MELGREESEDRQIARNFRLPDRAMTRPIGGFLPLRLPIGVPPIQSVLAEWTGDGARTWFLHNARSALHALWDVAKPRRVWLPAYVCSEVAQAVPLGIDARYYPLDETLAPHVDFLSTQVQDSDHVLAIDYFGRPVNPEFISFVRSRPEIGWVDDRAHALDSPDSAWGDWTVYSPRKLCGVPDGGILVARQKALPPLATVPSIDLAFALPSLARFEDVDETANERWHADYVREEDAMSVGTQAMSRLALELLKASDARADREVRRSNYEVLNSRLREWAFIADPKICFAPLGFPVRVKSAATLANCLSEKRIFAARHWKALPSDPLTFASEHQLAGELLTLPCDYRYDEMDMHRVADAVIEAVSTRL